MKRVNHNRIAALMVILFGGATFLSTLWAQVDSTPPAAINSLDVVNNSATSVTLTWTAPGDDGVTGTASSYDVRYATNPIDSAADFVGAVKATGVPAPKVAGSTETFSIAGLSKATIYYFSVKAVDESANASGLSNEASGNTRFEGYGYATVGGSGNDVYHVTSLADNGPGTLRNGILNSRSGPRTLVFDVGGTITLLTDINVRRSTGTDRITIDGSTAPSPGITVRKTPCPSGLTSCPVAHSCLRDGEFKIGANESQRTEEVILTDLRFQGNYNLSWGACSENSAATVGLQYYFKSIVLDHLTIRNSTDSGPDIWTDQWASSDVTYSRNLIAFSNHPLTISDSGGGGSRDNLSLHQNVLARSGERLPQVRFETTDFDFRNNVVFDWGANGAGQYGMRIPNDDGQAGSRKVDANIVNNYFVPGSGNPRFAFYYGELAGSESSTVNGDGGPSSCTTSNGCSSCPPQGTVVTNSFMGELWVSGNVFPGAVCEEYSTVSAPRPVPAGAAVTTLAASELINLLPIVGTRHRLADEQALLQEIAASMGGQLGLSPPRNLRIVQ